MGPSSNTTAKSPLAKETYVTVIGQSDKWYRVSLPDNSQGFLLKNQLIPLSDGKIVRLDSTQALLSAIRPEAIPVAILDADTRVEVLAHFDNYNFVRTENGKAGWLYN